jgi:hypothetical protein
MDVSGMCVISALYINMPTTASNGQMIVKPTEVTPVIPMKLPQISGSIAQAAAEKTAADAAQHAETAKALGAGQKGSGRRTRRGRGRKMRGGAAVQPVNIPTANSVAGQNPTDVAKNAVEALAQLKASAAYDQFAKATPMEVKASDLKGGFRLRGAEYMYPGSGTQSDTKGKRKTKKKHGRRHRRTRRGKRSKHHTVRRRRSRRV